LDAHQDFGRAQKAPRRGLELKTNSAQEQYEMAKSLWGKGKWEEAEPYARKATEIDTNLPMSHIVLGTFTCDTVVPKSRLENSKNIWSVLSADSASTKQN
jgi:tetratricopeptide (TPR) repeat protein